MASLTIGGPEEARGGETGGKRLEGGKRRRGAAGDVTTPPGTFQTFQNLSEASQFRACVSETAEKRARRGWKTLGDGGAVKVVRRGQVQRGCQGLRGPRIAFRPFRPGMASIRKRAASVDGGRSGHRRAARARVKAVAPNTARGLRQIGRAHV